MAVRLTRRRGWCSKIMYLLESVYLKTFNIFYLKLVLLWNFLFSYSEIYFAMKKYYSKSFKFQNYSAFKSIVQNNCLIFTIFDFNNYWIIQFDCENYSNPKVTWCTNYLALTKLRWEIFNIEGRLTFNCMAL